MRPIGVTLIAVWQWISAAVHLTLGFGLLFAFRFVGARLANLQSGGDLLGKLVGGFGTALAAVLLLLGVLHLAGGIGAWAMKGWGRTLVLVLCVLSAVRRITTVFHPHPLAIVSLLVPVAAFVYLMVPEVSQKFS